MSDSSVEAGSSAATEPPVEAEPVATGTAPSPSGAQEPATAKWQFWALVVGSGLATLGGAILPSMNFEDGWSYETLVDDRGRIYPGVLLASMAFLVMVAGLPLLRRYATARGRGAVTVGLGLFAAGMALFALAIATDVALTTTANDDVDRAAGEAVWEFAQSTDAWETAPYWIGSFVLSKIGLLVFAIGARRARTLNTVSVVVLVVIGVVWTLVPPGPAFAAAGVAMTAALVWLGRRVLDGPAPVVVTSSARGT